MANAEHTKTMNPPIELKSEEKKYVQLKLSTAQWAANFMLFSRFASGFSIEFVFEYATQQRKMIGLLDRFAYNFKMPYRNFCQQIKN